MEPVHLAKDPGGLALGLTALGAETTLVTGTAEGIALPGIPIVTRSKAGVDDPVAEMRFIRRALEVADPDTVIVLRRGHSFLWTVLLDRLSERSRGKAGRRRWILKLDTDGTAASVPEYLVTRLFLLACGPLFDRVVVESRCAHRRLRDLVPYRGRFVVVPDGYSSGAFAPSPHRSSERRPVVLCVGRIVASKGQADLLRAFQMIATEFPDWMLRFVGPIEDAEYARRLRQAIADGGLSNRVQVVGPVSRADLHLEYRRASIFALLSHRESFGIVRIEALASGVPVVTTDAGCREDLEALGVRVVPINDAGKAAEGLRELMRDPELREAQIRQAQAGVLTWNDVTRHIVLGGSD